MHIKARFLFVNNYNNNNNNININIVKLATVVEGHPKAPFSIATTPRWRGGHYSFPWIAPIHPYLKMLRRCPRGVMVKAMNCGIVVREFVLQSRYYVHFRANTLGKGMNPLILPPAMGK